ncbi:MAG: hypothetical protein LBC02_05615 [Planctomycetaceae bacterium]|nr:hypothetical protein [Planctomycetaceae bacterium]
MAGGNESQRSEWFTFLGSFKYLLRQFVQYLFCCPDKPEWKSDNRANLLINHKQ